MSYRLSPILQGRLRRTLGMACPREVIRRRDGKVVAYVDSAVEPADPEETLTKAQVKDLGPLRRPD